MVRFIRTPQKWEKFKTFVTFSDRSKRNSTRRSHGAPPSVLLGGYVPAIDGFLEHHATIRQILETLQEDATEVESGEEPGR